MAKPCTYCGRVDIPRCTDDTTANACVLRGDFEQNGPPLIKLGRWFHAQAGDTPGHLHDVYTTKPPLAGQPRIHVGTLTKAAVEAWAKTAARP